MNVKFTVDYDLIELVDAIGLDYDRNKNNWDIDILVENIEDLVDNEEYYHQLTDEDLCSFLLNETLCEGLIYTQRMYD